MINFRHKSLQRGYLSAFLLSAVVLLAACGSKPVATTDNEFEASLMFDILYSRGLHVEKVAKTGEKPGWDIVIDEGWFGDEEETAVATQVLNDHGLPRTKESLPEAANPYGMTSPEEVKKRQNREKEIQIENHLYSLPGVIKDSVLIAQPDNDSLSALSGDKTLPTASVLIVQKELPPKFTETDVKSQVAGTVPDLKPDNIHVTITYQPLREIPLEKLAAQRRSNTIYALGAGLIILLLSALGAIWYMLKRRGKPDVSNDEQLIGGDEATGVSGLNRPALEEADEEFLNG